MLILIKRLAFGAAVGALPGGLLVSSTLIFRGEIALTLDAWGVIITAFGAIAGLLIGLENCVPKLK